MAAFKDTAGNEWRLVLTVGSVADVLRDTGVNLALTAKGATWVEAIFGADGKLASVLWVLCERQAKERGVEPDAFPYLLDGGTLEAAGMALADAVADFFPRSRIAKALRVKLAQAMTEADDRAVAALTDSPSPTNSPESAESIPAG